VGFGAGGKPELPEDAGHVLLDRTLGEDELVGDLLVSYGSGQGERAGAIGGRPA
jgi:hypothetical protein